MNSLRINYIIDILYRINKLICFALIFVLFSNFTGQAQEIGYLVGVKNINEPFFRRGEIYEVLDSAHVKIIIKSRTELDIQLAELFKESNFFEVRTENLEIYCEKKELVYKNQKLKFRKIKGNPKNIHKNKED